MNLTFFLLADAHQIFIGQASFVKRHSLIFSSLEIFFQAALRFSS
jgi:hypothetical protein